MKDYLTKNLRNVAILGHLGSGKTSLTEAMLYVSGAIAKKGEVEKKTTVSDHTLEEQNRQTSLTTSLIPIEWKGYKINCLDTPGSEEFVCDITQDLSVVKGAVVVVDATKGIEVGTERVWNELRKRNIPTIIYVNKMDKENIKFDKIYNNIRDTFGKRCIPLTWPLGHEHEFDGFVNAGSSSIASFSAPTFFEKGYQTFNFADPRSGSLLRTLAVSVKVDFDYGISTSGNYNNKSYSFKPDDETKRVYRHHIVNPYTGDCSQEHASVTIFSRTFNNAQLDALSTMFVNLPLDQCISFRNELLEKYPSHDLSFIIMDRNDDDSLTIYIDQELKGISTVKAENCKVIYE